MTTLIFKDGKAMTLNGINEEAMSALFGDEQASWIGKMVVIFTRMVECEGKTAPGLVIRSREKVTFQ